MGPLDEAAQLQAVLAAALSPPRIPRAVYRLQFGPHLNFEQARALIPYLESLGISDIYASPLMKPCGSEGAGYDTCDPAVLNPALGTAEDFAALSAALRERGLGLILDIVPNHMGVTGNGNAWWNDVLENGPGSAYAGFFDIDWHSVKPELADQLLLPLLEDQYGAVLEAGKLVLEYREGGFEIGYYENRLPVAPNTYRQILERALPAVTAAFGGGDGEADPALQEFQSILTAIGYLPELPEDPERRAERVREKEVIKRRLAALCESSPPVREALVATVQEFNGVVGEPRSFDSLDALLRGQFYRPAFWRVTTEEINYRRFFDIKELAAIRTELPAVFQAFHALVFQLLEEGHLSGLRIDHPDGLWNPRAYFRTLQEEYVLRRVRTALREAGEAAGDADPAGAEALARAVAGRLAQHVAENRELPLYVVAEKILADNEALPVDWEVAGTTGYDFLNQVNGLFVDSQQRRAFDRLYRRFVRRGFDFEALVRSSKEEILSSSLSSEINTLSYRLQRIAEKNRRYRDFTLGGLTLGVREVIAGLPIYRTYLNAVTRNVPETDARVIETAVEAARRRSPGTAGALFDFLRDTLLLRNLDSFREEDRADVAEFVMKFQQLTGPVLAKGVEDTAFYIYNRLISLNEVGGHPVRFGVATAEFHRQNGRRAERWPHTFLTLSTHDTKRSEDVRARIDVLSEIPDEWRTAIVRWSRLNVGKKTPVEGTPAPDRNDEYLFYQSLLGAWPALPLTAERWAEFRERMAGYLLKATREAKEHTRWITPDPAYEAAVRNFVLRVLPERWEGDRFIREFLGLQKRVAYYGRLNALAQKLLVLTAPGVPDIYQGTELWDLSLVDPDNRRPVDYGIRQGLLAEFKAREAEAGDALGPLVQELLVAEDAGRVKLYLVERALAFRRAYPALFADGGYRPLEAVGERAAHAVAFLRTRDSEAALTAAPRLVVGLTERVERLPVGEAVWQDTWVPLPAGMDGLWMNVLTGEHPAIELREGHPGFRLAALCRICPVALLVRGISDL